MRALIVAVSAVAALTAGSARAQQCPSRPSWPTTEWPKKLVDATAKADAIKALEDYAFTLTGKDEDRKGLRTNALVIIKNGNIVYERYARGFDETKRHISWSVAKSYSSALTGVALQQKALKLDDSICEYLSEYRGQEICDIKVINPITFSTGLAWQEEYEKSTYQVSSVISMLFGVGHRDQARHVLTHKRIAEPGKAWLYSTGDAHIASLVAKRALERKLGKDAFWTYFFDKIGAHDTVFEEDVLGTPLGGSMVFATPRDFAKFGYLMLNDGCWNNERILPVNWVRDSTTPSDFFVQYAPASEKEASGYSWWLNRPAGAREKPWKDSPEDAYAAIGHWGQFIFVIPSEDVVIVRTGDDRSKSLSENEIIKLSLEVAR